MHKIWIPLSSHPFDKLYALPTSFSCRTHKKRISIPVRPEAFFIRKEKKRSRGMKNGTNDKQVNIRLIALDMAMAYSKNITFFL